MYTNTNFQTKKALKEAVARGDYVGYFQPGPFGGNEKQDGIITVEGPQYPQPHTWYAECTVQDGRIVKVK